MANLIILIALAMQRNQLLTILTQSGQHQILIERQPTSKLRAQVIDLMMTASTDETN